MDCSSQYAMARLIRLKEKFDIAFGNDPDGDRHGIVTPSVGLMNPNHFLSVAVWYLFRNRPGWRKDTAIGKTFVTSSMIDRVANHLEENCLKSQSDSSGLWPAYWMAPVALPERKVPGLHFYE